MIKVVYQDDYLMVVDKPPGLVVDNSETQTTNTLENLLKSEFNLNLERSGIVHRLDKDTSGLLLIAKTPKILELLQKQFKERVVKKEYLALVHGLVKEKGIVKSWMGRNPKNRETFIVFTDQERQRNPNLAAREAVTEYEPLKRLEISEKRLVELFPDYSKIQMRKLYALRYTLFTLLRCQPLTGRTHQIRVQLKYIGFPVVGDQKYAGRKISRMDHRWCQRQFLHAAKLSFLHPTTGEKMEFESNLPDDLKWVLTHYLSS